VEGSYVRLDAGSAAPEGDEMRKSRIILVAASAAIAASAVPSLVSGNSRRTDGTLTAEHRAETPFIARMLGANEVPGPGDPDGAGAASITIDIVSPVVSELCWDFTFGGIATPTGVHLYRGERGTQGVLVMRFSELLPQTGGCALVDPEFAEEFRTIPKNFYMSIFNPEFPNGAIRGQFDGAAPPAGPLHYLPTPLRAYDSRSAGGKVVGAETRTISLATGKDRQGAIGVAVPPGATGALITVTAVQTTGPGFLTVYSAASPLPQATSLNFGAAGAAVTVSTQVAVDADGSVKLTAGPAGFHVIIDVTGYTF
jgi:hypothetical protein